MTTKILLIEDEPTQRQRATAELQDIPDVQVTASPIWVDAQYVSADIIIADWMLEFTIPAV